MAGVDRAVQQDLRGWVSSWAGRQRFWQRAPCIHSVNAGNVCFDPAVLQACVELCVEVFAAPCSLWWPKMSAGCRFATPAGTQQLAKRCPSG